MTAVDRFLLGCVTIWSRCTVLIRSTGIGIQPSFGHTTRFPAADIGGILDDIVEYQFTDYFENEVLRKRPYLKKEWCIYVIENAVRSEPQEHNRHRFWARIPELNDRYLRVVTLEDQVTIHNAFPDRGFKP